MHKTAVVLAFRGIQEVNFLDATEVQGVLKTISDLLADNKMPALRALRFLDFSRTLLSFNVRSLRMWRFIYRIVSTRSISLYDCDGYIIDKEVLDGPPDDAL